MIPDQVLEQLASASFDKAQVIIVTKMLLVTVENARARMRAEMLDEMRQMRADYGRLIIEAVEATEVKIFARLEEEKAKQEEAKRVKREAAAARKREREAAKVAALGVSASQAELFAGLDAGGAGGNGAKVPVDDENKSDIGGSELPPMKAAYDAPVTADIAAKFDENEAFKELKAQAQARIERGNAPTRPIGSPLAAIQSLGEALAAAWTPELEAQGLIEGVGQEGASDEDMNGECKEDILMIEQGAAEEMLAAAE